MARSLLRRPQHLESRSAPSEAAENGSVSRMGEQSDQLPSHESSEAYWTRHNVTMHHAFKTPEESLNFIEWRNLQYAYYIELMPVAGFDGKVVLDFGCGPGHDLIGFALESRPARLIGMDVSVSSMAEAELRLRLHGVRAELIQIAESDKCIPLPDASVDVIHSSGVLHHIQDPQRIMQEFRRVLRHSGHVQVMVYNYNSLWMHLYVAYQRMLVEGLSSGKTLREAFTASTDGADCPISECYTAEEFLLMARRAGFSGKLRGMAISAWEMKLFPLRWDAFLDKRLPSESRRFLYELTLDQRGIPRYRGHVAGVDACFELAPV
jgi:ubiquinone/menaquinone biosynthesis C-methylase UbiE